MTARWSLQGVHGLRSASFTGYARRLLCPALNNILYQRRSSSSRPKTILFIRHGLTEMNERLQLMPWYSDNFEDGALYDTRLSQQGHLQAEELHNHLQTPNVHSFDLSKVELLLASPLTRTLQTAEVVFNFERNLLPGIPRVSHPLLRERLYLSSEVGRYRKELQSEYPHWDFSSVPADRPWWYVYNTVPHVQKSSTGPNNQNISDTTSGGTMSTAYSNGNDGGHEHDRLRTYITEMQNEAMHRYAETEEITAPQPVSFYDSYATTVNMTETADEANINNMHDLNSELYLANANRSSEPTVAGDANRVISDGNTLNNASNRGLSEECNEESDGFTPYVEWRPAGKYCCEGEPNTVFTARIKVLRQWLLERPESCIVVVTHWGVLKALTGREFGNCEMQVVSSEELLSVPVVDH